MSTNNNDVNNKFSPEDESNKSLLKKLNEKENKRRTKKEFRLERRKHKNEEKAKQVDFKLERKKRLNEEKAKQSEFKLERKRRINEEKAKQKEIKKREGQTFFNFFTKWFFTGIILILLSFCTAFVFDYINSTHNKLIIEVVSTMISGLLSSIGVALIIGCVFDFAKNSDAFVSFVSTILSDIIVSKTFLKTLSTKDKEQALNLILQPLDNQVEQYANIDYFFKKKIKDSMVMFDSNFKTNLSLSIEAHKDYKNNRVYCDTTFTYTVYKLNDKFDPIIVYFEKEGSEAYDVTLISPSGEEHIIKKDKGVTSYSGGIKYKKFTYPIPEELEKYDHLMVKRRITEPGFDHWLSYYWQSTTPYEGINCTVRCFDDLSIKEFMIFDNKAYYQVYYPKDKKKLEITSSQWLESSSGFSFLVSEETSTKKSSEDNTESIDKATEEENEPYDLQQKNLFEEDKISIDFKEENNEETE